MKLTVSQYKDQKVHLPGMTMNNNRKHCLPHNGSLLSKHFDIYISFQFVLQPISPVFSQMQNRRKCDEELYHRHLGSQWPAPGVRDHSRILVMLPGSAHT